jgi:transcriptional regulator with XRE-family HTH domain
MVTTQITGSMLRAGRALAGVSQEALARRAGLHRQTIWAWERASGATPAAYATKLARVVDVLESEGVRFAADGVHLDQPRVVTVLQEVTA